MIQAHLAHVAGLKELAIQAFADHRLVDTRSDRWRIARIHDGLIVTTYATEVVVLWGGRLYVGGDIDDCVFAYYYDSPDPVAMLRWIGECNDLVYVCQKAGIGLSDNGKLTTERRGRKRVPSARIVYAWAAVRRLCELQNERIRCCGNAWS